MADAKPRIPPSSNEMFRNGFYKLVQHNANTPYPHEDFEFEDGGQMHSTPQSSYDSPGGSIYQDDIYNYAPKYPQYLHPAEVGQGTVYEGYPPNVNHYGQSQYATPARSSLSPSMIQVTEPIRTRSGLTITRPIQPHKPLPQSRSRAPKSPKVKKPRKDKAKAEKKVAKLEKPLSELTKDWTHVPVVDIEAYVNRSAEQRRKEVEEGKIPGKVKRPMNSFMLYRKAYQNRTKNWCLQNNHQVVSQVCGDSWPLESDSVRKQFNEWARVERVNHQNAHPGYKFSPSKSSTAKPMKRGLSEEDESEESELDDFDWERGQSRKARKQPRQESRQPTNEHLPSTSPYPYSRNISEERSYNKYHKSSYQATNPKGVPPAPYNQANLHDGQYYQQTVHQSARIHGVEDVMIRRTAAPGTSYPGLSQELEYGLMGPYYHQDMTPEQKIDPSLVAYDNAMFNEDYGGYESIYMGGSFHDDQQWNIPYGEASQGPRDDPQGTFEGQERYDQHLQMLKRNQDSWQVESFDPGREFDKWMDEA